MKKLIAALSLTFSMGVHSDDWAVSEQVVLRKGENTSDFVAINVCIGALTFGAPANDTPEGTTIPIKAQMRVDTISPWEFSMTSKVMNGILLGQLDLDPELLKELIQGSKLRVKWKENVISRFDLEGLSSALKQVKCDSEYFKEKTDSDYFT